jgi:hypothetical protein
VPSKKPTSTPSTPTPEPTTEPSIETDASPASSATSPVVSDVIEMPTHSEPLPDRFNIDDDASDDAEPAEGDGEPLAAVLAAPLSEDGIRGLLATQAFAMNRTIGRTPDHWIYTDDELELIVPGLARIARRSNALRRVAEASDGVAVAAGFTGYIARNLFAAPKEIPVENSPAQEPDPTDAPIGPGLDDRLPPVGAPPR